LNNKVKFPVGYTVEDIVFNLRLMEYVNSIDFYNKSTISCLKRKDSITATFNEKLGKIFLFIDKEIRKFYKNNDIDTVQNNNKRKQLLARNTIIYINSMYTKKCKWSYEKKKITANNFLNKKTVSEAFNVKSINPYFNSKFKIIYLKLMFKLIKHDFNDFSFRVTSILNQLRNIGV